MSFTKFIARIFACFHIVLTHFSTYLEMLMKNNFIKLSLYIGIFLFLMALSFEIIGLLPRILKIHRREEDQELIDFEKGLRRERMNIIRARQKINSSYKPKMVEVYEYDWLDED